MTNVPPRFRCPACGFAVFNRRVPHCERCHVALPPSLLFDAEDLQRLEDEAQRLQRVRDDLAREDEAEQARRRHRRGGGG